MSGIASATVVNIDFNTVSSANFVGLAAAADPAGGATATWNPLVAVSGTASSGALNDSTGALTGIGFTLGGLEGSFTSSATNAEQEIGSGFLDLMRDYVRIDTGSTTSGLVVTTTGKFTGLIVGGSYEIYFYGQGNNFGGGLVSGGSITQGQNSLFTIGGTSKQTEWDNQVGGINGLMEDIEYVRISAVGDSNGEINFSFANVVAGVNAPSDLAPSNAASGTKSSRYGALNAIQLVHVVPEPSSAILSALGLIGLLARRRR